MSWKNTIKAGLGKNIRKQLGPENVGQLEERDGYFQISNEGGKSFATFNKYSPGHSGPDFTIEITPELYDELKQTQRFDRLTQIAGSHGPSRDLYFYLKKKGMIPQ